MWLSQDNPRQIKKIPPNVPSNKITLNSNRENPSPRLSRNSLTCLKPKPNKQTSEGAESSFIFTTNQEYLSTQTNQQLHITTNTLLVNIRLHQRAVQTWQTVSHLQIPLHTELSTNLPNIQNFQRYFPSSLSHLQNYPNPVPRYY